VPIEEEEEEDEEEEEEDTYIYTYIFSSKFRTIWYIKRRPYHSRL
jgi:hypothetical protein